MKSIRQIYLCRLMDAVDCILFLLMSAL